MTTPKIFSFVCAAFVILTWITYRYFFDYSYNPFSWDLYPIWNKSTTAHDLSTEKLILYNNQIEVIRNQLLHYRAGQDDSYIKYNSSMIQVADAEDKLYFEIISDFKEIRTVFYQDSFDNISQYLRPVYYDYVSNNCSMLEQRSLGGNFYGRIRYGAECRENFSEAWQGHVLPEKALDIWLSNNEASRRDKKRNITFIHIIPDAISLSNGDVIHHRLKIVPRRCKKDTKKALPKLKEHIPRYEEVFTITQYWGSGFYHSTLEDLPRIAPYLHFLHKHRNIRIHVSGGMRFLNLLGFNKSRLVTHAAVHADILYMPAGGPCGNSPIFTTQTLANVMTRVDSSTASIRRNLFVLIKRSHKRWFGYHVSILRMLQSHASRHNLTVEVFADKPLPDIHTTVDIFRRALVVVAPHGAGEANLIFSQPGTLLIEGLCYELKKTNLCYRNMAQALGLRYYGLIFPHQCINITANQIEQPVLEFLSEYHITKL